MKFVQGEFMKELLVDTLGFYVTMLLGGQLTGEN